MTTFEIIAVIVSVIGVSLTIMRSMWCWVVNIVAVAMYGYFFFHVKLYGETILQLVFLVMNFYGFSQWFKGQQRDHSIRIEQIKLQKMLLQMAFAASGGLIFGLSLHFFTDAAVPILDAQLAAFSMLATYWTSQKYIATWMLWVVVDIVYVGMFAYKELYPTALLYAAFVGMAAFGWWQWQQIRNQQQLSAHGGDQNLNLLDS